MMIKFTDKPTFAKLVEIDKSFVNFPKYKRNYEFEICERCGFPYGMHRQWGHYRDGCPSSISNEWHAWGYKQTHSEWGSHKINYYRKPDKKFKACTNGKTEAFKAYLRLKGAQFEWKKN